MTPAGPNAFLVGAGPGDPGLITRRGLELVRSCDVLLYDRLVHPSLVSEAPSSAETMYVGKIPGAPSMPQAEIDSLIVKHAREGKRVVRLKGGDPFVFGRGADEAQALAAAGIAFEIVPGVSSAIAVPAYAGIPVTHSGMASSFAVVTAHESSDRPGAEERWRELARGAGTLVLMMGVAGLEEAAQRLIAAGRDASEPAAVVERGTTSDQRTVVGTLETIAEVARDANVESPAVTVVGSVVQLSSALSWFESRPLFGRRVIVTRQREQARELVDRLQELGAEAIVVPTISIEDPVSWDELDAALKELEQGSLSWVVFASANAVAKVFDRLDTFGKDVRAFGSARIAAVGPATERALAQRGLRADLVPTVHKLEALIADLGPPGGKVLLPRPQDTPSEDLEALRAAGWEVLAPVAYRTTSTTRFDPRSAADVREGRFDVLTFASGSAARAYVEAFGTPDELGLAGDSDKAVVCIGPTTAEVARNLGFKVTAVAEEHSTEGLVAAILEVGSAA